MVKTRKNRIKMKEMGIDEEKYFVSLGMRMYGGSFVKSLGQALNSADHINLKKIKDNWSQYWEQYLKMRKTLHEKQTEGWEKAQS